MSAASQKDTYDALHKMGVVIKLKTQVKDYQGEKVILSTGEEIETRNLIWTAGVTAIVFDGMPPASYGKGKRLLSDAYNKVTGVQDIYAIGDTCLQLHEKAYPGGHPQLAQVSIQQGKLLDPISGPWWKEERKRPLFIKTKEPWQSSEGIRRYAIFPIISILRAL